MTGGAGFEITSYRFDRLLPKELLEVPFAQQFWPIVYLLSNGASKHAYVGETSDAVSRMVAHFRNATKSTLTDAHLIYSDRFNKSATLDIEANLIKYLDGDGQYKLLNGNLGLSNHNYYQKYEVYREMFQAIWRNLRELKIAKHSLEQIDNLDTFKYSPFKTLSAEQRTGVKAVLRSLLDDSHRFTLIEGGAGSGKTVMAVYLFKLLNTPLDEFDLQRLEGEEYELAELARQFRARYPQPRMALVVSMSSFRSTLKKVFRHVKDLHPDMVIGPAELAQRSYDLLVVDEAHRLRQRVNLGSYYRNFDQAATAMGFDKHTCTEVDWVQLKGRRAVFFYDKYQSIRPSDANEAVFDRLRENSETNVVDLFAQFRVRGGKKYVQFLHRLLYDGMDAAAKSYQSRDYDLKLFSRLAGLRTAIQEKEKEHGLSRLVAGYAWPWLSKTDKQAVDIHLDGLQLRWNGTNIDWVNSPNAINEVGCIHTTQGYDLNYTGIIFGPEIGYDPAAGEIVVRAEHYHDKNGKATIKDPKRLKNYILNIYRTLMLRGIRGTYIYVCDDALRDYFSKYIPVAESDTPQKPETDVAESDTLIIPFENSVPLYDLSAAAGNFSEQQQVRDEEKEFIRVPEGVRITRDHFACRVIGESMNQRIPNGSICLFRKYSGGSRNGQIVLAQHTDRQDADFGSQYTVKEYHSTKYQREDGWHHLGITLSPLSNDPGYEPIHLQEDELSSFSVIGLFERVVGSDCHL